MSRPFKLFRLQQLDSQLDRTRARLKEIEEALNEDSALRQATQAHEAAQQALEQARKQTRQAEEAVKQQRIKIELDETALYSGKVRLPKELQDLQNEVASLKRFLVVLEDRQLEAMLAEEETATALQAAQSELEKVRAHHEQLQGELLQEQGKLQKDLRHLEEERGVMIHSVPSEDLELYQQLRQKRRGIAVSKVVDRSCSACGSTLSTSLLHIAHSPNQLTCCEVCGRILYTG